jgi:hypothetical protein
MAHSWSQFWARLLAVCTVLGFGIMVFSVTSLLLGVVWWFSHAPWRKIAEYLGLVEEQETEPPPNMHCARCPSCRTMVSWGAIGIDPAGITAWTCPGCAKHVVDHDGMWVST